MEPNAGEAFVDYYELMQISPGAERETIVRVYRMLAARYHPDNKETGDTQQFALLVEAYRTLTDQERRTEYDIRYTARRTEPLGVFGLKEFTIGVDGENNRRLGLLCLLYSRCRTEPEHPGMSVLELERMMSVPREHLLFTLWYLREKDFIAQDGKSDYYIKAEGVDYVEQHLPQQKTLYRLLKAAESGASRDATAPPWPVDPAGGGEPPAGRESS
jgi:curved DNA-binding protein CbpA